MEQPSTWSIEEATEVDVPRLALMLARAFEGELMLIWEIPDLEARRRILPWRFEMDLRDYLRGAAQVHTDEGRAGVAIWESWDACCYRSLWSAMRLRFWRRRQLGSRRLHQIEAGLMQLERARPREPFWELATLGVDPARQNRGLGAALMRPMLARCDHEGAGVYAQTTNARALPFYARCGFAIRGEALLPEGPPVWLLWREPQPWRGPQA